MDRRYAELLLAGVIFARSTSLLFAKIGLEHMEPLGLLAARSCVAFAVLALIFARRLRQTSWRDVGHGMLLGGSILSVMIAETFALRSTNASTTSFLENTAIVFVPLFEAALCRRLPERRVLITALVTLSGVGLLTLRGGVGGVGLGEGLALLAACLYAMAIILTGRLSRTGDPFLLGVWQVGAMALFSTVGAGATGTLQLPPDAASWGVVLVLALVCSCFGFTLQPVAQRYTGTDRAAQLCAVNPLSVAILGALFLGERLGAAGLGGAALILAGILVQSLWPTKRVRPGPPEQRAAADPGRARVRTAPFRSWGGAKGRPSSNGVGALLPLANVKKTW